VISDLFTAGKINSFIFSFAEAREVPGQNFPRKIFSEKMVCIFTEMRFALIITQISQALKLFLFELITFDGGSV